MTKATPESSDSLVFECDLAEPPEKVWRALTEPRLLAAWLTPDPAETDSEKRPVPYEIVSADPHRLLRYRWRDRESAAAESAEREVQSLVTVELAPAPEGGTHLRLTHADFRIVPIVAPVPAADVTPITSALRCQTPTVSFAAPRSWLRAA